MKKKGHMGRNLGLGCLGLILLILIIAVASNAGKNTNTTSTPAAPDKSSSAAPAKSSAPPAAAKVLLDVTGTGTKQTQKFTAGGDWDLEWSYDCATFGSNGNFIVSVYNGDASISFENSGVNQLGAKGADVQHYHKGGTFYLDVNSECSWHVTAKG